MDVRGHWGIENKLHWSLDVTFREDNLRQRVGHSAENLSRIRRIALNLLRQDKSVKVGAKVKRFNASLEDSELSTTDTLPCDLDAIALDPVGYHINSLDILT